MPFVIRTLAAAAFLCVLLPRPCRPEDEEDWRPGLETIDHFCKLDEFASAKVTRLNDAGLNGLFPACRFYAVDAVYKPGHPKAEGAVSTQRTFALRAKDARAFASENDADWSALALAEELVLKDEAAVRRFVTRGRDRFFAGGLVRKDGERSYRIVSGFSGRACVAISAVDVDEKCRFTALRSLGTPTFDEDPASFRELQDAIRKESEEKK